MGFKLGFLQNISTAAVPPVDTSGVQAQQASINGCYNKMTYCGNVPFKGGLSTGLGQ